MKPDDFMNALKATPRPEFEAELRQRLAQLERKKYLMLTIKRSMGLAAAFIALTFVTLVIAAPDVLAQMGDELERIAGFRIERSQPETDVPVPEQEDAVSYYPGSGLSLEDAAEQYGFDFPDVSDYGLEWVQVDVFVSVFDDSTACPLITGQVRPATPEASNYFGYIRLYIGMVTDRCNSTDEPRVKVGEDTVLTEVRIGEYAGVYTPGVWSCSYRDGDETMDCDFDNFLVELTWSTEEYRLSLNWATTSLEQMLAWMGGEIVATHTPTAVPTEEG